MARVSGKNLGATVNGTEVKIDEYTTAGDVDPPDMSASGDNAVFRVPGLPDSQIDLAGPWDSSGMAILLNTEYTVVVRNGSGVGVKTMVGICSHTEVNNKLKDGPRWKATFKVSDGQTYPIGI